MSNKSTILNTLRAIANNTNYPKKYAYFKAMASIANLPAKEFRTEESFNALSIPFVGSSISRICLGIITNNEEIMKEIAQKTCPIPPSNNPHKHYTHRDKVTEIIKPITDYLNSYKLCGSYRRGETYCGDADILVKKNTVSNGALIDYIRESCLYDIICFGDEKIKLRDRQTSFEIDIRFCTEETEASMALYFTGPKEFNINMRRQAKRLGLTLNEYGIIDNGHLVHFDSEVEIFDYLNITYVPPTERRF